MFFVGCLECWVYIGCYTCSSDKSFLPGFGMFKWMEHWAEVSNASRCSGRSSLISFSSPCATGEVQLALCRRSSAWKSDFWDQLIREKSQSSLPPPVLLSDTVNLLRRFQKDPHFGRSLGIKDCRETPIFQAILETLLPACKCSYWDSAAGTSPLAWLILLLYASWCSSARRKKTIRTGFDCDGHKVAATLSNLELKFTA